MIGNVIFLNLKNHPVYMNKNYKADNLLDTYSAMLLLLLIQRTEVPITMQE